MNRLNSAAKIEKKKHHKITLQYGLHMNSMHLLALSSGTSAMLQPIDSNISPWKRATDSPSRQLLRELGQLHISQQRSFREQLEKQSEERDVAHRTALAAAAAQHERIRNQAEAERERILLEEQLQQELEHQEQLKEIERVRREAAERQLIFETQRIKEAKAAEAAERAAQEAEERRRAVAALTEQSRVDKEKRIAEDEARANAARKEAQDRATEAEAKARVAAQAAIRANAQPQASVSSSIPTPTVVQPTQLQPLQPTSPSTTGLDREAEHRRYLQIHQDLKKLRGFMMEQSKLNPQLKQAMGEKRREIRKRVGQLTEDKKANQEAMRHIRTLLIASMSEVRLEVNVSTYLFKAPSNILNTMGPGLLLYLLNIFAKSVINQFLSEAAVQPKLADSIGIIASSIFAQSELQWNGIPLIDILLAKFHAACPVLFGIYGPDTTIVGKTRLGWKKEEGRFVTDQRHSERMTGLGAGFAAITLRNYGKSKLENPLPPMHYWQSVARIVNTPPDQVTTTHYLVLKAMIEHNEDRILQFFGDAGMALLRKAVVDFPAQSRISDSVAARALALLRDIFAKEANLYI